MIYTLKTDGLLIFLVSMSVNSTVGLTMGTHGPSFLRFSFLQIFAFFKADLSF